MSSSAHHAAALVTYSRRLRASGDGDLQAAIVTEMRRAVLQVIESGLLNGTGTGGQPLGLIQQSATGITFAGAVPTFIELLAMLEALADGDGDPSRASWLLHPSDAAALARTARARSLSWIELSADRTQAVARPN